MDISIKSYKSHSNGFIKVTLFSINYSKKLFKYFSFYLLTFLSWTFAQYFIYFANAFVFMLKLNVLLSL